MNVGNIYLLLDCKWTTQSLLNRQEKQLDMRLERGSEESSKGITRDSDVDEEEKKKVQ